VRNLADWKSVEIQAEGERDKLERLIDYLKVGPPGAKVERLETKWSEYTANYADFGVRY
jgi:acylphosphatase